jgi:hypothetical protein
MGRSRDNLFGLSVALIVYLLLGNTTQSTGVIAFTFTLIYLGFGEPFNIIGGIITLGIIASISSIFIKYGVDALALNIVKRLMKEGKTKIQIINKMDKYPLSENLLLRIESYIDENQSTNQ